MLQNERLSPKAFEIAVHTAKQDEDNQLLTEDELKSFIISNKFASDPADIRFLEQVMGHFFQTYTHKKLLHQDMKFIIQAWNSTDPQLSESTKAQIILKFQERAIHCTPGFHNGLGEIVKLITKDDSLAYYLQVIREDLVRKAAIALGFRDTHEHEAVNCIAFRQGYGVRANMNDIYAIRLDDNQDIHFELGGINQVPKVTEKLNQIFDREYQPFSIVSNLLALITQSFREQGYKGKLDEEEYDYTLFSEWMNFYKLIFNESSIDLEDYMTFLYNLLYVDEQTNCIKDINWNFIKHELLNFLLKYIFKLPKNIEDLFKSLIVGDSVEKEKSALFLLEKGFVPTVADLEGLLRLIDTNNHPSSTNMQVDFKNIINRFIEDISSEEATVLIKNWTSYTCLVENSEGLSVLETCSDKISSQQAREFLINLDNYKFLKDSPKFIQKLLLKLDVDEITRLLERWPNYPYLHQYFDHEIINDKLANLSSDFIVKNFAKHPEVISKFIPFRDDLIENYISDKSRYGMLLKLGALYAVMDTTDADKYLSSTVKKILLQSKARSSIIINNQYAAPLLIRYSEPAFLNKHINSIFNNPKNNQNNNSKEHVFLRYLLIGNPGAAIEYVNRLKNENAVNIFKLLQEKHSDGPLLTEIDYEKVSCQDFLKYITTILTRDEIFTLLEEKSEIDNCNVFNAIAYAKGSASLICYLLDLFPQGQYPEKLLLEYDTDGSNAFISTAINSPADLSGILDRTPHNLQIKILGTKDINGKNILMNLLTKTNFWYDQYVDKKPVDKQMLDGIKYFFQIVPESEKLNILQSKDNNGVDAVMLMAQNNNPEVICFIFSALSPKQVDELIMSAANANDRQSLENILNLLTNNKLDLKAIELIEARGDIIPMLCFLTAEPEFCQSDTFSTILNSLKHDTVIGFLHELEPNNLAVNDELDAVLNSYRLLAKIKNIIEKSDFKFGTKELTHFSPSRGKTIYISDGSEMTVPNAIFEVYQKINQRGDVNKTISEIETCTKKSDLSSWNSATKMALEEIDAELMNRVLKPKISDFRL